ncbi:MAG TPA: TIGR04076 family protein [Phototrophicaceae bacterium]|nr:TIGR04076 family protein [Phototrophicaceae bacterium]
MDFELYDLRVTVVSIEGRSVCGMQIGDSFDLVESSKLKIPAGKHFCIYALNSVIPFLAAKQRELADNDWLARDSLITCPDPEERLVMKIERISKRTLDSDELT